VEGEVVVEPMVAAAVVALRLFLLIITILHQEVIQSLSVRLVVEPLVEPLQQLLVEELLLP
jgi:hypothetical protein